MKRSANNDDGTAILITPVLVLVLLYLVGFFIDLGDAFTKADALDQTVSLAAAAATSQISESSFYQTGAVVLDPSAAQTAAIGLIESQIAPSTRLAASPLVRVSGGGVCVRISAAIKMPFTFIPGQPTTIQYSTSSSALAKGSSTTTPPTC